MDSLRELPRGSVGQLVERASTARSDIGILAGRRNDDAVMEIIDQVSKMMKFAGYVIGHARGADTDLVETGSAEDTMLEEMGLRIWFDELAEKLDAIYEARNDWEALSVFHPLHRSFEIDCLSFKLQLLAYLLLAPGSADQVSRAPSGAIKVNASSWRTFVCEPHEIMTQKATFTPAWLRPETGRSFMSSYAARANSESPPLNTATDAAAGRDTHCCHIGVRCRP